MCSVFVFSPRLKIWYLCFSVFFPVLDKTFGFFFAVTGSKFQAFGNYSMGCINGLCQVSGIFLIPLLISAGVPCSMWNFCACFYCCSVHKDVSLYLGYTSNSCAFQFLVRLDHSKHVLCNSKEPACFWFQTFLCDFGNKLYLEPLFEF